MILYFKKRLSTCVLLTVIVLQVIIIANLGGRDIVYPCQRKPGTTQATNRSEPTKNLQQIGEFDTSLREILRNTKEIGYLTNSWLNGLQSKENSIAHIKEFAELFNEQKKLLLARLNVLRSKSFKKRNEESQKILGEMQVLIVSVQNPTKCGQILRCVLPTSGFGAQIHHIIYCFMAAFAMKRVLVLENEAMLKTYNLKFESIFKPLSERCKDGNAKLVIWNGKLDQQDEFVTMDFNSISRNPLRPFEPPVVPTQLKEKLQSLMGEPGAWFTGVFVKYVMRLQPEIEKKISSFLSEITSPVVGIHIRRTDKIINEAQRHEVDEYMRHVIEFYDVWSLEGKGKIAQRNVYVASDDATTLNELKSRYPDYNFIVWATENTRSESGLNGIVLDIITLSRCDYLVCTFSSNVCRLSYELMHTRTADASLKFASLDDIYYHAAARDQVAVLSHEAKKHDELDLKIGDVIGVRGNHWDGFSLGLNRRTNKVGTYPSFKCQFLVNHYPFSQFDALN